MRYRKFVLLLLLFPLAVSAQIKFGYFNYNEVLKLHPQYQSVQSDYDELVKKCEKEILRNEEELTRCYVAFLDGQKDFPEPILRKRQKELQELVDGSILFRDQLKTWLVQAQDSLFNPLYATIEDVAARVCIQNKLAYAINLETAGYLFVNPQNGVDITDALVEAMKSGNILILSSDEEKSVSPEIIPSSTESEENINIVECDEKTEIAATSTE